MRALVTLSRQLWLTEQGAAAWAAAEDAMSLAARDGEPGALALATLNLGGLNVVLDREHDGLPLLDTALQLAEQTDQVDLAALCHNYRGSARLQLGQPEGRAELLLSIQTARARGNHEYVMRGYYNLVEGVWRLGEYDDAAGYLDEATAYGQDRDFPVHFYMFDARRCRLLARRGALAEAEAGLRDLVDSRGDPGMIGRETLPILARVLVRLGRPDADELLELADQHARRADVLEWLVPTGLARLEQAWLTGRPELAGDYPELLLARTDRAGMAVQRGELLRYLRRLGLRRPAFADCPEGYAEGIGGDWRAAAEAWERLGDPYERALELAESGEVEPTLEAYAVLDQLGARPAAELVRRRLRRARGQPAAATDEPRDTGQPGRPHRTTAGDPAPARGRRLERPDRRRAGHLLAHRRPPRLGDPAEAGRADPSRGGGPLCLLHCGCRQLTELSGADMASYQVVPSGGGEELTVRGSTLLFKAVAATTDSDVLAAR